MNVHAATYPTYPTYRTRNGLLVMLIGRRKLTTSRITSQCLSD